MKWKYQLSINIQRKPLVWESSDSYVDVKNALNQSELIIV